MPPPLISLMLISTNIYLVLWFNEKLRVCVDCPVAVLGYFLAVLAPIGPIWPYLAQLLSKGHWWIPEMNCKHHEIFKKNI